MNDFDFMPDSASEDQLTSIHKLVEQTNEAAVEVERLKNELKAATEVYVSLSEKALPDAMADAGLSDFTTAAGLKVAIKNSTRVSLTVKDRANYRKGLAWLEENGYGKGIRHTVSAVLGKDSQEAAERVAELLAEAGFDTEEKRVMPAPTINSVCKEILDGGEVELPEDVFNVYRKTVAFIK